MYMVPPSQNATTLKQCYVFSYTYTHVYMHLYFIVQLNMVYYRHQHVWMLLQRTPTTFDHERHFRPSNLPATAVLKMVWLNPKPDASGISQSSALLFGASAQAYLRI